MFQHGADIRERDEPGRTTANLFGIVMVLIFLIVGLMLVRVLADRSRLEDCFLSGRTNCAPVDPEDQGRR